MSGSTTNGITYYPFTPSVDTPFQFSPTLDGNVYTVIVTFNLFGQRYYINLYTVQGTLLICTALVASPVGYNINLIAGVQAPDGDRKSVV